MAYITREDGEHFVIPSYRDVLTAKSKSALKKDILLLSESYGEYVTMQRKGPLQYEVAFSTDTGYLLGESVWHYFKRPMDMIYCEAIPNTTEAILVIVKSGSVYLDGSFPIDSIPEELVIFLTQQNNFEIFVYGDVPIARTPEEGKFAFDATSIKSFDELESPVFQTLPLLKIYQLQLVDTVLKAQGIGVFPWRQLLTAAVVIGLLWMGYSYLSSHHKVIQIVKPRENPYQPYLVALSTPAPDQEINVFLQKLRLLYGMPGWNLQKLTYTKGQLVASVMSNGSKVDVLALWAKDNNVQYDIRTDGIYVTVNVPVGNRPRPDYIYPIKDSIANFIDNLSNVYPGNHLQLGNFLKRGVYTDMTFTLTFGDVSPALLALIGEQMRDLPFVLQQISANVNNGSLTGSMTIEVLGS